jgi:hypothetical protein
MNPIVSLLCGITYMPYIVCKSLGQTSSLECVGNLHKVTERVLLQFTNIHEKPMYRLIFCSFVMLL